MDWIKQIATTPRLLGLAVAASGAGALISAFIMQFGFGLYPCVLCIYQRFPFAALIVLGLGLAFAKGRKTRLAVMLLSCIALASSVGLSGYHMGVEQGVFQGTSSCSPDTQADASLNDLRAMIESAPIASCSDVAAEFMGFSIAGWNMLFSLFLLLLQLYGTVYYLRKHTA